MVTEKKGNQNSQQIQPHDYGAIYKSSKYVLIAMDLGVLVSILNSSKYMFIMELGILTSTEMFKKGPALKFVCLMQWCIE